MVVMGGLHASLNYAEAVEYCDYVLLGEGDESIVEFIESIDNKRPITFPGAAYKKDNEIVFTRERRPPEDIDVIPDSYLLPLP